MTNSDNANTANTLPPVDIDRVINAMTQFDITLEKAQGADSVASANLNGLGIMFAVLPSVIIVRADVGTDASFANADAGLFLAAGQSTLCLSVPAQLLLSTKTSSLFALSANSCTWPV